MIKVLLALFGTACAWAQPAIAPPQIGYVQDRAGVFRPVLGIAGNFLLPDADAPVVTSAAFSGRFGLIKTDAVLAVTDVNAQIISEMAAPSGPALFAFTREGEPALAYLPNSSTLLQWNGAAFARLAFDLSGIGSVLSIGAPDAEHAAFLVEREDQVWDVRVVLATGEPDSQAATTYKPPVLMLASGVVVGRETGGFIIRRPDGRGIHLPAELPDISEVHQTGEEWVQAGNFLVRTTAGKEGIFVLPGVGP